MKNSNKLLLLYRIEQIRSGAYMTNTAKKLVVLFVALIVSIVFFLISCLLFYYLNPITENIKIIWGIIMISGGFMVVRLVYQNYFGPQKHCREAKKETETEHVPLIIFIGIGTGTLNKSVLKEFRKHIDKCPACQKLIDHHLEEFKKRGY